MSPLVLSSLIAIGLAATHLLGKDMGFLRRTPRSVWLSIAGGVLKEELPEERESRFWAFGLGAFGYSALLLAIA